MLKESKVLLKITLFFLALFLFKNHLFPLKHNPFYIPGEDPNELLDLFISDQTSKELAEKYNQKMRELKNTSTFQSIWLDPKLIQ